jgi:serine/threonine-protein kinase
LQQQIAQEIAGKLLVRLTQEEKTGLSRRYTDNITAYQAYLQGQKYTQRRTREDVLQAIDYYQKAIQEDSNYALAYAGLTEAYIQLTTRYYIAPGEGHQKAREAAIKALSLDANLAEAHMAAGLTGIFFTPYDFSTGDRELRRAIELSPSLAEAHHYLSLSLLEQGRRDEALQEILSGRDLDPLAPTINRNLATYYYLSRDYPRALETLRKSFELGPPFVFVLEAEIYLHGAPAKDLAAELERIKPSRPDDALLIFFSGMADAADGKRREALAVARELEKSSGPDLRLAPWIARIYLMLNERELALSWLERGFEAGAIAVFFKDAPLWDPIRGDPRFAQLMRRMTGSR